MSGVGSAAVQSLANGTNFLQGITKGAITGAVMGAISFGVYRVFFTKKVDMYMEDSEANTLSPGTPVGNTTYARELCEKQLGLENGLNKNDVYRDASRLGGKMNAEGSIEYTDVVDGKKEKVTALGVTRFRG